MAHERAAVGLDDGSQGGRVEVAAADPAWELVVPHAVVSYMTVSTSSTKERHNGANLSGAVHWPLRGWQ